MPQLFSYQVFNNDFTLINLWCVPDGFRFTTSVELFVTMATCCFQSQCQSTCMLMVSMTLAQREKTSILFLKDSLYLGRWKLTLSFFFC